MVKYVLKNNQNQEVKIGDELTISTAKKNPDFELIITRKVDEEFLQNLIDYGVIVKVDDTPTVTTTVDDVVAHMASRIGWKAENLDKYLSNLYNISPIATFQILLKEYAIMADRNYKDHISKASKLWAISALTGEVFEMTNDYKGKITNVALFRTEEAAESARVVFKKAIEELF